MARGDSPSGDRPEDVHDTGHPPEPPPDGDGPREEGIGREEEPDPEGELPVDGTLGGYMAEHGRPPSFEGSDGRPYTVSVEVEQIGDLRTPFAGYLIFPRWSPGGREIDGHVQTPLLARGRSHDAVVSEIGELTLKEIKTLLENAVTRTRS